MEWYNKYIGLPYKEKGRDREGLDCWGLVRLIYSEEFNINLPSFAEVYNSTEDHKAISEAIHVNKEGWDQVQLPKAGDVILFNVCSDLENHIGIVTKPGYFIHAVEGAGVSIQSYGSPAWKKRVEGIYRYKENSNVTINAVTNPLKNTSIRMELPEGATLAQVVELVKSTSGEYTEILESSDVVLVLNNVPIQKEYWNTIVTKSTDILEYRSVPKKSIAKILLVIVIAFVAWYAAPYLAGASSIGGSFGAAGWGALVAGSGWGTIGLATMYMSAINMVGGLLSNALFPVRPPKGPSDPGTATEYQMVGGAPNSVHQYGSIPVVLGKMKFSPPLAASPYYENYQDYSSLKLLATWGYGPLKITDLTIDKRPIDYVGFAEYSTYDGINGTPEGVLDIYGKEVKQENISLETQHYVRRIGKTNTEAYTSFDATWEPATSSIVITFKNASGNIDHLLPEDLLVDIYNESLENSEVISLVAHGKIITVVNSTSIKIRVNESLGDKWGIGFSSASITNSLIKEIHAYNEITQVIDDNVSKIRVDITYPQGCRAVISEGGSTGDIKTLGNTHKIQVQKLHPDTLEPVTQSENAWFDIYGSLNYVDKASKDLAASTFIGAIPEGAVLPISAYTHYIANGNLTTYSFTSDYTESLKGISSSTISEWWYCYTVIGIDKELNYVTQNSTYTNNSDGNTQPSGWLAVLYEVIGKYISTIYNYGGGESEGAWTKSRPYSRQSINYARDFKSLDQTKAELAAKGVRILGYVQNILSIGANSTLDMWRTNSLAPWYQEEYFFQDFLPATVSNNNYESTIVMDTSTQPTVLQNIEENALVYIEPVASVINSGYYSITRILDVTSTSVTFTVKTSISSAVSGNISLKLNKIYNENLTPVIPLAIDFTDTVYEAASIYVPPYYLNNSTSPTIRIPAQRLVYPDGDSHLAIGYKNSKFEKRKDGFNYSYEFEVSSAYKYNIRVTRVLGEHHDCYLFGDGKKSIPLMGRVDSNNAPIGKISNQTKSIVSSITGYKNSNPIILSNFKDRNSQNIPLALTALKFTASNQINNSTGSLEGVAQSVCPEIQDITINNLEASVSSCIVNTKFKHDIIVGDYVAIDIQDNLSSLYSIYDYFGAGYKIHEVTSVQSNYQFTIGTGTGGSSISYTSNNYLDSVIRMPHLVTSTISNVSTNGASVFITNATVLHAYNIGWGSVITLRNTGTILDNKALVVLYLYYRRDGLVLYALSLTDSFITSTFDLPSLTEVHGYKYNSLITSFSTPTSNPASLYRYVLQHPANSKKVPDDKIDLEKLAYWTNFCRENGYEYNSVLANNAISVDSVLRDIAAAGRASPAYIDGKWSVVIDEPRDTVVQHFTPYNTWGFEAVKTYPKLPHAFRIPFFNATRDWREDEVLVYANGYVDGEELTFSTVTARVVSTKYITKNGSQVVDGVTLVNGDIVLLAGQGDTENEYVQAPDNGIWVVNTSGNWARHTSYDSTAEYLLNHVFSVSEGTEYSGTKWVNTKFADTIDVHNLAFTLYKGVATLYETISLPGVTRRDQAFKFGRFHLGQITLRPEKYTFNVDMEHLVCTRGDLVRVTHDIPMWGTGSGRIENAEYNGTNTVITITDPVDMDSSKVYKIRIRVPVQNPTSITDTVQVYTCISVGTTGKYSSISISGNKLLDTIDGINILAYGNLFVLGEENLDSNLCLVESIEPLANLNARVTVVDYSPEIYSITESDDPIPPFTANITKNIIVHPNSVEAIPTISGLVSDETIMTRISKDKYVYALQVLIGGYYRGESATNPRIIDTSSISHIEVQIDPSSSYTNNDTTWSFSKIVPIGVSSVTFNEDIIEGEAYRVRARYISSMGVLGSWTSAVHYKGVDRFEYYASTFGVSTGITDLSSYSIDDKAKITTYDIRTTIEGRINPPKDVQGIGYEFTNTSIEVTWDSADEPDVEYYKVIESVISLDVPVYTYWQSNIPSSPLDNEIWLNTADIFVSGWVTKGTSGTDVYYHKAGTYTDFTMAGLGIDTVVLPNVFSYYSYSISGSVITILSNNDIVKVLAGNSSAYDYVIFSDFKVKSVDLFNYIKYGNTLVTEAVGVLPIATSVTKIQASFLLYKKDTAYVYNSGRWDLVDSTPVLTTTNNYIKPTGFIIPITSNQYSSYIRVKAVDSLGKESAEFAEVYITQKRPNKPTNINVSYSTRYKEDTPGVGTVEATANLSFDSSSIKTSLDIAGYEIRTPTSGNMEPSINEYGRYPSSSTTSTLVYLGSENANIPLPIDSSVTNKYYIRSYDLAGNYSLESSEIIVPSFSLPGDIQSINLSTVGSSGEGFKGSYSQLAGNSNLTVTSPNRHTFTPGDSVMIQFLTGTYSSDIPQMYIINSTTSNTIVVTKPGGTAGSGTIATVLSSFARNNLLLEWVVPSKGTLPILGYEIRENNSNWGDTQKVWSGDSSSAQISGVSIENLYTWYIKAYDTQNNYSANALTVTYDAVAPNTVTDILVSRKESYLLVQFNAIKPADFAAFMIKVGKINDGIPDDTSDFWDDSDVIVTTNTIDSYAQIPLSSFTKGITSSSLFTKYRVAVRIIDKAGKQSTFSALGSYTYNAPTAA